ncbi:MAG: 2-hydroxyacyl-CoA dehydratase family protein [Deltaproteobacteria bacterium]|nr:2-hydroxyacyl-CoA dehydratase family protein [Deltaproteobacteria bacterium]
MSRIDAIIEHLAEVAANPRKAAEEHARETGQGAVGVMPVYAPEEIIHAAGFLPMGMWGGQVGISKARAHTLPFTCSIMQSIMEQELNGVYDDLDAVVFSVPCDTLKCMSQKWQGKSPAIAFTHPQNRKIPAAVPFLTEEYKLLQKRLENILGLSISEEALHRSVEVYNENRGLMREFSALAGEYAHILDPLKRHAVIKSRWFMEKSRHSALVRELLDEIKKQPARAWSGKKVVLTGIMAEPAGLLEIFKDFNFAVVDDDLAQEGRQYRNDAPAGDNPLERLARWWQDFDGCSLATDPLKPRGRILLDMVKKHQADAVIVCMMKFCDPEEFDYPVYRAQLEKAGVPLLVIEVDLEAGSFEQVRTRLQTFSEMLAGTA